MTIKILFCRAVQGLVCIAHFFWVLNRFLSHTQINWTEKNYCLLALQQLKEVSLCEFLYQYKCYHMCCQVSLVG